MSGKQKNDIRSVAVRKLLSKKPRLAIRLGSAGILLLLSVLIGLSWFVPYPEVVVGEISIRQEKSSSDQVKYKSYMKIPFRHISSVEVGQKVNVSIEGIPGELDGRVETIGEQVYSDNQNSPPYYRTEIRLLGALPSNGKEPSVDAQLQGRARIITDDMRLFERIFGKIRSSVFAKSLKQ